ncbi:GGDEF domain-containing protein [Sporomusa malonica]|uniref:Diguanylate cyclase (GGDEF) domain-containing protein n=1 Tax=Sporomusa malonica TaxID=112901 RepID=A0A1W1ZA40_9FIRM|nr:GGDEF domain-containing protein [Sporomusa malonica]SMC45222.1 diguanylate cyclase (GGDEF) domain-containing protein [Sporomusa malonica]
MDDFESIYRAYYLVADARHTRVAIAVWLIPVLLFAYSDYLLFGYSSKFVLSLAIRLVFFVFSLYTIYALFKVSTGREYDYIFLRWAMFATAVVLFINYSWAPYVPPNGSITMLILFSAYMVFPNRFCIRVVPPLILSIGTLTLHWRFSESVSLHSLHIMLAAFVMANVLGVIFSSSLEKHRRTEFKARLDETRAKEELNRLASIDHLTGILNRRKLVHLTTKEFERFRSSGQSFSVLMIDIDYFKKLNDSYGHAVGDMILREFAAYVANSLYEKNIWGRLGGDEFVLVLLNLPSEQSKQIAERLRLGVNRNPIIYHGKTITFSISIGIAEARDQDSSFESVLKRADEALYHAKRNGRGRIEVL